MHLITGYCIICQGILKPIQEDPPKAICMVCERLYSLSSADRSEPIVDDHIKEIETKCKFCRTIHPLIIVVGPEDNWYMLKCEQVGKTFLKKIVETKL